VRELAFDVSPAQQARNAWQFEKWPGGFLGYVAQRKLGLSVAYYTGMHTLDVWDFRGGDVGLDIGRYVRRNSKSAGCIRPEAFDMPEGLRRDLEAERARLGRDFGADELICGGPWGMGQSNCLERACRLAHLPRANLRTTFRHSTVYNYLLCGWSERDVADILGHVDQRMIREVYRHLSVTAVRSPVRVPWTYENVTSMPWRSRPRSAGQVLPFERPRAEEGGDAG
jgi:integrase